MRVQPNQSVPGAIVTELPEDLTALTVADTETLKQAYDEHGLLVLRGRAISIEEQIAVCGAVGTVVDQSGNGQNWFNITNLDGGYDGKLCFHADFSNAPENAMLTGASLYGAVLPQGETATLFANTGWALEALPQELKDKVAGLASVHSSMHYTPKTPETPVRHARELSDEPRVEHPLVFVHPKTGQEFLFVSDLQSEFVQGLAEEESLGLLDQLTAWIQQPKFVYRHVWQLHDLVLWDQIMMQHSRNAEQVTGERTLRRVSFTYPGYAEGCQAFFASMGDFAGKSGTQDEIH